MSQKESMKAEARAFEEEIMGVVEVTVKMPKPLVEFLKAVKEFTRAEESWEEIAVQQLIENTIGLLDGNSLDEIFPGFEGVDLKKAYNLDKLDC